MAAQYDHLHQLLAQAILAEDKRLTADFSAFVARFLKSLPPQSSSIPPDAQDELTRWLTSTTESIRPAIGNAIRIGATAGAMTDQAIADLAAQMYSRRWPNGINLSQRLWTFRGDVKGNIEDALVEGVRQMRGVNRVVYDMQRAVESASGGELFKIVQRYQEGWVDELSHSALTLINDDSARTQWVRTIADIRKHINQLAETGTRSAAERVFAQIIKAVRKGNGELVANAIEWWIYDQQLYNLKRIARSEMANSGHLAIIESTIQDDSVLGYQWRLSASHPEFDICDYYANIDMGLGRGVFPKNRVPRAKAHPHCFCNLVPRVTHVHAAGEVAYPDLLARLKPEVRDFIFPYA